MPVVHLSADDARTLVTSPDLHRQVGPTFGVPGVIVECDGSDLHGVAAALALLPVVTVAVGLARVGDPWDLITTDPQPISEALERNPITATTAAIVLRSSARKTLADSLAVESFAYSALQTGGEHARWLESRGGHTRSDGADQRVVMRDLKSHIEIAMTRPRLLNLIDAAMRDQLADAFKTAAHDPRPVTFVGDGRAFSAGGDPAEFGTAGDPATASLVRLGLGVAPWIAAIADRVTAVIDGPCVGAGIELAAFAGRIEATPRAMFRLPELTMGLIPGAGGTTSIPARIGSRRTLDWMLRDLEVDAETALDWGLIDAVIASP